MEHQKPSRWDTVPAVIVERGRVFTDHFVYEVPYPLALDAFKRLLEDAVHDVEYDKAGNFREGKNVHVYSYQLLVKTVLGPAFLYFPQQGKDPTPPPPVASLLNFLQLNDVLRLVYLYNQGLQVNPTNTAHR